MFVFISFELVPELVSNIEALIKSIPGIINEIKIYLTELLKDFPDIQKQILNMFNNNTSFNDLLMTLLNNVVNGSIGFISNFISSLITIFTALVFAIYMLSQKEYLINSLKKLLKAYDNNNYIGLRNSLILEILYSTGIRVGEIVNIKYINISMSEKTIKIVGKGNKERIVFFGKKCYELLELYFKKSYNKLNINSLDYLFLSKTGKKISDREVRKIVDDAASIAGIEMKISPHVLRHTFATHLLNEGCDILIVKELLGHSSLDTTGIYTHVSNERLRKVYLDSHPRAKK